MQTANHPDTMNDYDNQAIAITPDNDEDGINNNSLLNKKNFMQGKPELKNRGG